MRSLRWAYVLFALGACFSTPGLRQSDGGIGDGGGDDGADAPPDAACVPAEDPPEPGFVQLEIDHLAAGFMHACAIDTAGAVWCWGSNDHGQLGARTDSPGEMTGKPGLASPMTGWTSIAASSDHSCGITGNKVYCWGRNDSHQTAPQITGGTDLGPTEVSFTGVTLLVAEVPTKVFTGPTVSCTITSANRAICWGRLSLTVPGAPTQDATLLTAVDDNNTTWSSMALAEDHACAVAVSGQVYCWGMNDYLQLGESSGNRTYENLANRSSTVFSTIAVGPRTTCGTTPTNELHCWGSATSGHLGVFGSSMADEVWVAMSQSFTSVAMGNNHVCATTPGNTVLCYGENTEGALGNGQYAANRSPQNTGTSSVDKVVAGENFSCVRLADGQVKCWGTNVHGELGLGSVARKELPSASLLPIGNCESVLQVVAGDRHTCALVGIPQQAGRAYCWGNNEYRQVTGNSMDMSVRRPVRIQATELFTRLSAGERHTCGLRDDGNIRCWGSNDEDQLGQGGSGPSLLGAIGGMTWTYVAAGSRASCGILQNGKLYCWGDVPVAGGFATPHDFGLVAGRHWSSVALGSGFGVGTAFDPTNPARPYIYGFAPNGCQLDSPGSTTAHPPNDAIELFAAEHIRVNVAAAQANGAHLCVHQENVGGINTVTCVGNNDNYQVGDVRGTTDPCVPHDDPEPPPGMWRQAFPGVATIAVSGRHSCSLDTIGRPYCWGSNNHHELGPNTSTAVDPRMINDELFSEITTGAEHTCGIDDARRSVRCWGDNRDGQVGDDARSHAAPTPAGLVPP